MRLDQFILDQETPSSNHISISTKSLILGWCLSLLIGCNACHLQGVRSKEPSKQLHQTSGEGQYTENNSDKNGDFNPDTHATGTKENDPFHPDQNGRTGLHNVLAYLKSEKDVAAIKFLLASAPNLRVTDNLGRNLLHEVAYGGNLEIVQCLLDELKKKHSQELETMINQTESSLGKTPWVYAIRNRNIDLARLLVQYGARPTEPELIDALRFSIKNNKLALLQYMLDEVIKNQSIPSVDGGNLLHIAAKADWPDLVEYLIDTKHINIQASDDLGMAPLHYAALHNNRRSLIVLLKKEASVDARQQDGKTALHLAVEKVHRDAVFSLLTYGAAIDIRDHAGKTALDLAQQQSINDTSLDLKLIKKKLDDKLSELAKQTMDGVD